jgi:hypothetical protein
MPDLDRRQEFEDQLARGLARIWQTARSRLVTAVYREGYTLGQLANIPPDVLVEMQTELERLFRDRLDDVFVNAAQAYAGQLAYGIDEAELQQAAVTWANEYAPLLAQQMTTTTRAYLTDIARRAPDVPVNQRNLLFLLIGASVSIAGIAYQFRSPFNTGRAVSTAITEVTNAISAGERAVNDKLQTDGVRVDTLWYTQRDERVCPVCAPRHGTTQGTDWNTPPPAHPNCRCYLGYRLTNGTQVTILFDDNEIATELARVRR